LKKLLNSYIGDIVEVENKEYTLTKKEEYLLNGNKAFRFTLFSDTQTIILEIKREFALNYQIFKYSLIDSFEYNNNFISILGTNTLGYNNPKLSKTSIYKKVKLKKERYDLYKHIVSEDDLPEDYQSQGYHKDANGYYYFFTKKYSPQIKKSAYEKRLSWEYKQDNNIRLMIETKGDKNSKIFIYKGKELRNSDLEVRSLRVLETSQQQEKSQRQDSHYLR